MRGSGLLIAGALVIGLQGPAFAATVTVTAPASVNQGASATLGALVEGTASVPTGTVSFTASGAAVGSAGLADETYETIAVGRSHACAITAHGALQCFGNNSNGQLGTGDTTDRTSPVTIFTEGVTAVSGGNDHSCAVVKGALKCFGGNALGQLGNGTTTATTAIVEVFASGVTAVAAGVSFTCAVVNSDLHCWGLNNANQLGDGTITNRSSPVQILTGGVTAVAAGTGYACAIQSGALFCWGNNSFGQLGDGTATQRSTPTQVSGMTANVEAVGVGAQHSCAVQSGDLKCWGDNTFGRLGTGNTTSSFTPVAILGGPVTSIGVGTQHTCAVQGTETKCWGRNNAGQLGDGTTTTNANPSLVSVLGSNVTVIGGGNTNSCAIENGAIFCWGSGGRIGDGTNTLRQQPTAAIRRLAYTSVTTSSLPAGTLSLVASYGGDTLESAAASSARNITVNDKQAPSLTVPGNRTLQLDIGASTTKLTYSISATDNLAGTITLARLAGPASGSALGLGRYTITHRATDLAGNATTRSFTVTVVARNLTGSGGNDSLYGSSANETLNGGDGNDLLDGKGGADTMNGGKGNDTYYVDQSSDKVVEKPGEGTDKVITAISYVLPANVEKLTLTGAAAVNGTGNGLANSIDGNVGANRLTGGGEADVIKGGKGADRFIYLAIADSTARKPDTLADFRASDRDRIDLARIDANSRKRGNQAFTFIGAAAFSKTAGELRFAKRRLEADVNGDGKADLVIKVLTTRLTAAEILR